MSVYFTRWLMEYEGVSTCGNLFLSWYKAKMPLVEVSIVIEVLRKGNYGHGGKANYWYKYFIKSVFVNFWFWKIRYSKIPIKHFLVFPTFIEFFRSFQELFNFSNFLFLWISKFYKFWKLFILKLFGFFNFFEFYIFLQRNSLFLGFSWFGNALNSNS